MLAALLPAACGAQGYDTASGQAGLAQARAALDAAERGAADVPLPPGHPLAAWVEYARLRKGLDTLSGDAAQNFLNRYRGQAAAETFRDQWLTVLAKREDWPGFRAAWSASPYTIPARAASTTTRSRSTRPPTCTA